MLFDDERQREYDIPGNNDAILSEHHLRKKTFHTLLLPFPIFMKMLPHIPIQPFSQTFMLQKLQTLDILLYLCSKELMKPSMTTINSDKVRHYDILIVGAGLYGAVFAHEASLKGKRVAVIDRRGHLGGNIHCKQMAGINVHAYGAHIFHTDDKSIWEYVNSIVPFNRFTNSPIAVYKGKLYHLPFNLNTFYDMWGISEPDKIAEKLERQKESVRKQMEEQGVSSPRNLEEQALLLVGPDVYERLIQGYTEKQWGRPCSQLPAFIIRRLPVRMSFDNNYFNDSYQGIPIGGYNILTDKMLEGCDCWTGTDFFNLKRTATPDGYRMEGRFGQEDLCLECKDIVYTGEIDRFFDYQYGRLEYRTVEFDTKILHTPNFQGNAVINYTEASVPYTRIIEHKHFEMFGQRIFDVPDTVVSYEYPREWKPGLEPYYPINDAKNSVLYNKYKELADRTEHIIFGGRLAEYKYYDMAPTIAQALKAAHDYTQAKQRG